MKVRELELILKTIKNKDLPVCVMDPERWGCSVPIQGHYVVIDDEKVDKILVLTLDLCGT